MYVQDILLLKKYRRQGIGSRLIGMFLKRYENVRQKGLLTDDTPETIGFYKAVGFANSTDKGMVYFIRID